MKEATHEFLSRIAQLEDKQIIQSPDTWPWRFALPLTHKTEREYGLPRLGVLYNQPESGVQPVVYLGDIYTFVDHIRERTDLGSLPQKRYESLDALLADWRVD